MVVAMLLKYSGIIVVIVIMVLNVLGTIMKKRADQQRKLKLAKLSDGRTQSSTSLTQTTGSSLGSPTPLSHASRAMDRAEQLAARRKAQLDELRSRREQRRAGTQQTQQQPHQQQQQPQARIGPGSSQTPSSTFRSTPQQIPQPTPVPTQRVVIRPSAQPKQVPVSRGAFVDHSQHERADTQRLHGRRAQLGETTERITTEPARISPTSSILGTEELTPELLRRMVVLKEIFELPVSLRDRDVCDRL